MGDLVGLDERGGHGRQLDGLAVSVVRAVRTVRALGVAVGDSIAVLRLGVRQLLLMRIMRELLLWLMLLMMLVLGREEWAGLFNVGHGIMR